MAAVDLTTKTAVRAFLQKQGADTGQDAIIDTFITAASKLMMRYAQREFAPASSAQARKFILTNANYAFGRHVRLSLAPYDLRAVTSVVRDSDTTSPVTLASTDYKLRPQPSVDGTYGYLRFEFFAIPPSPTDWEREITITGDWGFTAVPEDVANWATIQVADWIRRDVSAFGSSFSIDEGRLERPEALISTVRKGLESYRRGDLAPLVA
jgi:hypothetical protein